MQIAALLLMLASGRAFAGNDGAVPTKSPRAELKESIERLQKTPDDAALREKIIKLARSLKPAPAVPEEARRHFVKATAIQKEAKSSADYALAAKEYRQAVLVCPWWADAYYNAAAMLEADHQYAEAIRNLKLSILAKPDGPDARATQDKIYALEGKSEVESARRNSPEGKLDALYKSLDGGVWKRTSHSAHNYRNDSDWGVMTDPDEGANVIEVHGHEISSFKRLPDGGRQDGGHSAEFSGREVSLQINTPPGNVKITISDDGQEIVEETWAIPQPSMYWRAVYKRAK